MPSSFSTCSRSSSSYTSRILDILEPMVGRKMCGAGDGRGGLFADRVHLGVAPNQTPDSSAVRSQQVVESTNGGAAGALPTGYPARRPTSRPAQPAAHQRGRRRRCGAAPRAGRSGPAAGSKRESIINYEVDKTVRVVRGSTGMVKRISAAVV
jgi:flagellar M-ring protein FliF